MSGFEETDYAYKQYKYGCGSELYVDARVFTRLLASAGQEPVFSQRGGRGLDLPHRQHHHNQRCGGPDRAYPLACAAACRCLAKLLFMLSSFIISFICTCIAPAILLAL
eukprot:scaffold242937_cov30-Prasinocladus_malaysianus.AAC.1